MARRSAPRPSTIRISSVAGSPLANSNSTFKPCAVSSRCNPSRYPRSAFISSDSRSFRSSKCRAANPSATCTSSSSAPVIRASAATWARIVWSAVEFSIATRMRLYIAWILQRDEGLVEQPDVEGGNDQRDRPGEDLDPRRVGELIHFRRIAGEHHERKHREGQLQAQNHLAQDDQRA